MSIDTDGYFKVGLRTTEWLNSINVYHINDVVKIGVIEVCMRLRKAGYPVTINMAYGLQADIMGTTWTHVPDEIKSSLSDEFNRRKILFKI